MPARRPAAAGPAAGILLALGALAACGDAQPSAGSFTVRDSAGVSIAVAEGAGWAADRAWRLELDLDVGSVDGPDAFGRLVDVAPRRGGGVWIVDSQERRVRGYDGDGREVLSFGRAGDGPGEFRSIGSVHEGPDGGLGVGAPLPPLLHRFDAAGEELARIEVPAAAYRDLPGPDDPPRPPLGPTIGTWRFGPDGHAYLQAMTLDAPDGDIVRTDVLLRLDPAASGVAGARRLASWSAPAMPGGPGGELRLFTPTASWSPTAGGGAWVTSGETYELRELDADGRPRRILRRPAPRSELTPAVREAFLDGLRELAESPGALAMLEQAAFPDSLPATAGLWATATDGPLWVGVLDPSLPLRQDLPNAFDVFGPEGRYLGRVPMPDGFRPTRVTTDHVYGIWVDDLDVTHARRYRIVRGE